MNARAPSQLLKSVHRANATQSKTRSAHQLDDRQGMLPSGGGRIVVDEWSNAYACEQTRDYVARESAPDNAPDPADQDSRASFCDKCPANPKRLRGVPAM